MTDDRSHVNAREIPELSTRQGPTLASVLSDPRREVKNNPEKKLTSSHVKRHIAIMLDTSFSARALNETVRSISEEDVKQYCMGVKGYDSLHYSLVYKMRVLHSW